MHGYHSQQRLPLDVNTKEAPPILFFQKFELCLGQDVNEDLSLKLVLFSIQPKARLDTHSSSRVSAGSFPEKVAGNRAKSKANPKLTRS